MLGQGVINKAKRYKRRGREREREKEEKLNRAKKRCLKRELWDEPSNYKELWVPRKVACKTNRARDAKTQRERGRDASRKRRDKERQRKREAAPTLWPRLCALALRPSSNHQPPLPNSSISFSLSLARSATLERSPPSSLRLLSPSWDDVSPLLRRSILLSLGARHGSSERQPSAIRIKPREAPRRGEREREREPRITDVARADEIFPTPCRIEIPLSLSSHVFIWSARDSARNNYWKQCYRRCFLPSILRRDRRRVWKVCCFRSMRVSIRMGCSKKWWSVKRAW